MHQHLDFKLLESCRKCGACYVICPSCINLSGYDPRAVIVDILAGKQDKWLDHKSIWQCLECHECLEMCGQHYGFENAMTAMRALAIQKGKFPPQIKRGWDMFVKSSRLGEPTPAGRKKYGLPPASESGAGEFTAMIAAMKAKKGGSTAEGSSE